MRKSKEKDIILQAAIKNGGKLSSKQAMELLFSTIAGGREKCSHRASISRTFARMESDGLIDRYPGGISIKEPINRYDFQLPSVVLTVNATSTTFPDEINALLIDSVDVEGVQKRISLMLTDSDDDYEKNGWEVGEEPPGDVGRPQPGPVPPLDDRPEPLPPPGELTVNTGMEGEIKVVYRDYQGDSLPDRDSWLLDLNTWFTGFHKALAADICIDNSSVK